MKTNEHYLKAVRDTSHILYGVHLGTDRNSELTEKNGAYIICAWFELFNNAVYSLCNVIKRQTEKQM